MPPTLLIHFLNKPRDAAGLGHAALLLPADRLPSAWLYFSFYASKPLRPRCPGTLLALSFPTQKQALDYAKTEGYTREIHWPIAPENIPGALAAIQKKFASQTPWSLLSRNCWHAVKAALQAAKVPLRRGGLTPNAIFKKNHPHAAGSSQL